MRRRTTATPESGDVGDLMWKISTTERATADSAHDTWTWPGAALRRGSTARAALYAIAQRETPSEAAVAVRSINDSDPAKSAASVVRAARTYRPTRTEVIDVVCRPAERFCSARGRY